MIREPNLYIPRFSHYFDDGDKDQVKNMMQIIYNSRIPNDDNHAGQGYDISIKCGSDQDKNNCGASVFAATDPEPGKSNVSHQNGNHRPQAEKRKDGSL